jgi:hypothetical protein
MFNGDSAEVVPVKTIEYPMTKKQLFEDQGCARNPVAKGMFLKFYGTPDDQPCVGLHGAESASWGKVSEIYETYLKDNGLQPNDCVFVDWSTAHFDFKNIDGNLKSVDGSGLSAPLAKKAIDRVDPLSWWGAFRSHLGLERSRGKGVLHLRLNLGNLYSITHPDDKKTLETAHTADTDTKMLIAVVKFFLDLWNGVKGKGRIEQYMKVIGEEDQDANVSPPNEHVVMEIDGKPKLRSSLERFKAGLGMEPRLVDADLEDIIEAEDDDWSAEDEENEEEGEEDEDEEDEEDEQEDDDIDSDASCDTDTEDDGEEENKKYDKMDEDRGSEDPEDGQGVSDQNYVERDESGQSVDPDIGMRRSKRLRRK